ncbi:hypothetical protein AAFO90_09815, partial [Phaeobacter sp. CAU 1743]|uniref:hypothetical protein n=1 Tax=Phaeobacter sp. CAU 1743 TaxID=3140367 RepID=UPI00325BAF8B
PIRPAPGVCATADAARREKRLSSGQNQAILTSDGRPLGECRFQWHELELETDKGKVALEREPAE